MATKKLRWKLLPGLKTKANPCLNCPPILATAAMDMVIAVGFGSATVTKDGAPVYDEQEAEHSGGRYWTVKTAERAARKDPDHDWRINKHGPLHGESYQRQGENKWVLVETNEGFA